MYPSIPQVTESSRLEDLPLAGEPSVDRLESITVYLDSIEVALSALTKIPADALAECARELGLEGAIASRLTRGKLANGEEMRALVLVLCHLARRYHELIRRAVILLEQVTAKGQEPQRSGLLADYLDNFRALSPQGDREAEEVTSLAWKLLIDLFFYSGRDGCRRLWLILMESINDEQTNP
jgi:Protein of unknown function (DUF3038)